MTSRLLEKIFGQQAYELMRGIAAFGSAEIAVRIVRLITIVLMARRLDPQIMGSAALTLTLFELIRVFANIGVGQRIITADASELPAICNTALRIFWFWCVGIALAQCLIAALAALAFHQLLCGEMLALLSAMYLFMPGGLVQCYLIMRAHRTGETARTAAIQTIADHILTAGLLMCWQSAWALVLPKLLTAPIWLVRMRRAYAWHPDARAGYLPIRQLTQFGIAVLATDALVAIRTQCDNLIIAALLGVSALGVYYFAFNAGLGIMSSLLGAFGTVLLPRLTAKQNRSAQLKIALKTGCCLFLPLTTLQFLLADRYVPFVFGARWLIASKLVGILCLAAIPMFFATLSTAWLRVSGRPGIDVGGGIIACITALGGLTIGALTGSVQWAVTLWVAGLFIGIMPFSAVILWKAIVPSAVKFKEALT